MGKVFLGFIIAVILGFVAFTWVTLHWAYSEGERAGFLQKFSRKGWICKTYEGELTLMTPQGLPSQEPWEFTVRDEAIAKDINAALGKNVVLHYQQHPDVPTSCFGESQYFVDGVRITE